MDGEYLMPTSDPEEAYERLQWDPSLKEAGVEGWE